MSKLEQCQMLENHFNEQESNIARAALGASLIDSLKIIIN